MLRAQDVHDGFAPSDRAVRPSTAASVLEPGRHRERLSAYDWALLGLLTASVLAWVLFLIAMYVWITS